MEVNFDKLIGQKGSLYYNNTLNSFQLGSVLFEVVEDENDGYRSMMQEVKVVTTRAPKTELLAEVMITSCTSDISGFVLVDTLDNHVWLEFGTNHQDDYYPYFVFSWTPKLPPSPIAPSNEENIIAEIKGLIK